MEVLLVEAIDPSSPRMGGINIYSQNLLDYLTKTGCKVTLLGYCNNNSSSNNGFSFIPVAYKEGLTGYEYLLRLITKIPFLRIPTSSIIHVQRPQYLLPFVLFHRKNPRMVTLHGQILDAIRLKRKKVIRLIYEIVESFVLKHSDIIIAVDEQTNQFYQQQYPYLVGKIKVIPIGIDLNKFRLLNRNSLRQKYGFELNDKIVVYVGRLEKEKDVDFLLNCSVRLVESVQEAKIVLVGDGKDRERLENLVKSSGFKRVYFMGALEPDKIPEILNCADILALCSFFEGSPTVVKEALACGVPVVSTDIGDVSQIIQNEATGRIVNKNEDDFTDALVDVLLKEEREKVRIVCAESAAKFGFDQAGAKTVKFYQTLVASRSINSSGG